MDRGRERGTGTLKGGNDRPPPGRAPTTTPQRPLHGAAATQDKERGPLFIYLPAERRPQQGEERRSLPWPSRHGEVPPRVGGACGATDRGPGGELKFGAPCCIHRGAAWRR